MESFVRNFIRASLVWLLAGVAIGVAMAVDPALIVLRRAHVHANTVGFVSMMIFGVAYHVMPRFSGNPLWSRRAARLHLWLANTGLALMAGGWISLVVIRSSTLFRLMLVNGAILGAAGVLLFVINIWRTLEPKPAAVTMLRKAA